MLLLLLLLLLLLFCCCYLQKPVFEGVAHEALTECVHSLHFASDSIRAKKVCSARLAIVRVMSI